ncbi:MAG: hypothetical protein WD080_01025 [Egibacteraceae bacterium]
MTATSIREEVGETLRQVAGLATPGVVRTVVAIVAVTVVLAMFRRHRTRRALRPAQRVRFEVLPTDTFDPSPEEIDRYAAQLARTRRAIRRGTHRSAHAVRLRLDAEGDGAIRYRLEGHRRAASILGNPGFHEVEIHPIEAEEPPDSAAPASARADASGTDVEREGAS